MPKSRRARRARKTRKRAATETEGAGTFETTDRDE